MNDIIIVSLSILFLLISCKKKSESEDEIDCCNQSAIIENIVGKYKGNVKRHSSYHDNSYGKDTIIHFDTIYQEEVNVIFISSEKAKLSSKTFNHDLEVASSNKCTFFGNCLNCSIRLEDCGNSIVILESNAVAGNSGSKRFNGIKK